eukprot:11155152-Lingulodinium_polyedra.AAC.1
MWGAAVCPRRPRHAWRARLQRCHVVAQALQCAMPTDDEVAIERVCRSLAATLLHAHDVETRRCAEKAIWSCHLENR